MKRTAAMLAGIGLASVLLGASPAAASHSTAMTHESQRVAVEGRDHELPVVAQGCWLLCSAITIEATFYNYRRGNWKSISETWFPQSTGHVAVVLTIPGRFVHAPELLYFVTATQTQCEFMGPCHESSVSSPQSGVHEVRVLVGP